MSEKRYAWLAVRCSSPRRSVLADDVILARSKTVRIMQEAQGGGGP